MREECLEDGDSPVGGTSAPSAETRVAWTVLAASAASASSSASVALPTSAAALVAPPVSPAVSAAPLQHLGRHMKKDRDHGWGKGWRLLRHNRVRWLMEVKTQPPIWSNSEREIELRKLAKQRFGALQWSVQWPYAAKPTVGPRRCGREQRPLPQLGARDRGLAEPRKARASPRAATSAQAPSSTRCACYLPRVLAQHVASSAGSPATPAATAKVVVQALSDDERRAPPGVLKDWGSRKTAREAPWAAWAAAGREMVKAVPPPSCGRGWYVVVSNALAAMPESLFSICPMSISLAGRGSVRPKVA